MLHIVAFLCAVWFSFAPALAQSIIGGGIYGDAKALSPSDGWTIFTASLTTSGTCAAGTADGTCIVYVSNGTGNDATAVVNDPTHPFKTIAAGKAALRTGYPDWLLLKNGDVWTDESFQLFGRSGRSAAEPMLLSSYDPANPTVPDPGTGGARPLIKTPNDPNLTTSTGITFFGGGGTGGDYVALVGIEFYSYQRDPSNPSYVGDATVQNVDGIGNNNPSTWRLIEDCKISYYGANIDFTGSAHQNIIIRRNVIVYAYSPVSSSQGLHVDQAQQMLVEENLLDHNGWNEANPNDGPSIFNRNAYLSQFNAPNFVTWRNNISARSSSEGVQFRTGGTVTDNLFLRDSAGFDVGHQQNDTSFLLTATIATNNVILESDDIGTQARGYGVNVLFASGSGVQVTNNIIAHVASSSPGNALFLDGDTSGVVTNNNIIYDWGTDPVRDLGTGNVTTPNAINLGGYPHPSPTAPGSTSLVGDYYHSIGGTVSETDFLAAAAGQSKSSWNPALTAHAVNAYVRSGFGAAAYP